MVLVGCGGSASADATGRARAEPEVVPAAAQAPVDPSPEVVVPESPDGPLRIEPAVAGEGRLPHEPDRTGRHASAFGWAADGKSFALCIGGGGKARECTVTYVDGKAEPLGSQADARLNEGGYEAGPLEWAHGRGVTLTWSAPEGKARLEIGARLDTGERVSDLVWMDFDPSFGEQTRIFPEVISIAPDGDRIAVVGHAVEPGRDDGFETILLHANDFAARAYAQAGFDHLGENRFERAIAAFERATAAHPDAWEHSYHLACARARAGQGNVRRPLARAIDLGGEKVRTKAHRDSALAGVKRTDWFKAMVSERVSGN